jgi:hypothetical protein
MIATRPFQDVTRGFDRNALDLPVAALAAVAVAFAAFAMPGNLLTGLVEASGLPSILAAAEPPLGLKARAGVGLAGALAAFGLVFLLLRLLDRTGLERARPAPPVDADSDMPKLRRRDVHPDAPVRRPISAARDLGEPAPPPAPARAPPAPAWLAEPEAAAAPERAPQPKAATAPEPAAPAGLDELMARLEQGLARRRAPPAFAPAMPQTPAPQVFPEAGDDRLQSAIDSLQRLAGRSH